MYIQEKRFNTVFFRWTPIFEQQFRMVPENNSRTAKECDRKEVVHHATASFSDKDKDRICE